MLEGQDEGALRRCRWIALVGVSLAGCVSMPPSVGHSLAGQPAPEFQALSTSSRAVGIPGTPRVRVTVVDFWASWCGECQRTVPAYDALWRDRKEDGVMVIGVSVDEREADAVDAAGEMHASFPILLDPGMRLASRYRVGAIPLTFVIDRKGTVRWVGRDPDEARRAVRVVLAE
jgi:cytochrome c biogenesis protein CcmG, thiol:disulfide interchange protein DsbE